MTCLLCGTQFPDGSPDCPHCQVAQASIKNIDQTPPNPPMQPEQPFPYQRPSTPTGGMQPAYVPAYIPSTPSKTDNKKMIKIIELVGVGVVLLLVIGTILFHSLYASVLNMAMSTTTLNNSTQTALNPYTHQTETLALSDPLQNNSIGDQHNYHWRDDFNDTNANSGPDASKGCYFNDKNYHVSTYGTNFKVPEVYCITGGARFNNFTYQVQMTIQLGRIGGILFRQTTGENFYAFVISEKGTYLLFSDSTTGIKALANGSSSYIHQLPGVSNQLAVVANGDQLDLYVNQHWIDSVTDTTYSVGAIGMLALGAEDSPTVELDYQDAKVWLSPK